MSAAGTCVTRRHEYSLQVRPCKYYIMKKQPLIHDRVQDTQPDTYYRIYMIP